MTESDAPDQRPHNPPNPHNLRDQRGEHDPALRPIPPATGRSRIVSGIAVTVAGVIAGGAIVATATAVASPDQGGQTGGPGLHQSRNAPGQNGPGQNGQNGQPGQNGPQGAPGQVTG